MRMVDEIAPELGGEEIIAQSFDGEYTPANFTTERFIDPERFEEIMNRARIIIAHAGIGSIMSAMKRGKPLVVVARRADLGEHRNDHQIATAESLARTSNLCVAANASELLDAVRRAPVPSPLPDAPSPELITSICTIIDK